MASGGDAPQLPRGLIGRTGTPSGKGTRLPSMRGPRDLTLGGVQKKVYAPNIPTRRNKSESGGGDTNTPTKSDEKKPKPGLSDHGRGDKGDRGRGRGRGRGRDQNIIQTHSLFEQGPAEKTFRPSIDRSDYVGGGIKSGGGGGGAGGGGTGGSKMKREKSDTESKEVIDQLLRDDFISGLALEAEDICELPVKLPLEMKADPDVKQEYTKVKIKDEPMEVDEKTKPQIPGLDVRPDIEKRPKQQLVSCQDLFSTESLEEEGQLMLFQFPDTLPGLPATKEEEFRGKKDKADKKEADKEKEDSNKIEGFSLSEFNEGLIGKVIVRKSGRVQMLLGSTYLDVNMGTPCSFLQALRSTGHTPQILYSDMGSMNLIRDKRMQIKTIAQEFSQNR